MKQRALPQSFWQQPNVANPHPPGVVCSNLPPLPIDDGAGGAGAGGAGAGAGGGADTITPVGDVQTGVGTSNGGAWMAREEGQQQQQQQHRRPERSVISAANTDLLFSLFNSVEEEEAQRRIHVVRRGRSEVQNSRESSCSSIANWHIRILSKL